MPHARNASMQRHAVSTPERKARERARLFTLHTEAVNKTDLSEASTPADSPSEGTRHRRSVSGSSATAFATASAGAEGTLTFPVEAKERDASKSGTTLRRRTGGKAGTETKGSSGWLESETPAAKKDNSSDMASPRAGLRAWVDAKNAQNEAKIRAKSAIKQMDATLSRNGCTYAVFGALLALSFFAGAMLGPKMAMLTGVRMDSSWEVSASPSGRVLGTEPPGENPVWELCAGMIEHAVECSDDYGAQQLQDWKTCDAIVEHGVAAQFGHPTAGDMKAWRADWEGVSGKVK